MKCGKIWGEKDGYMEKILYLMRHGQTLFNVRHKIQGSCDSPLTELGIQQAQAAQSYFSSIEIDHAYCSSAERASDTLEIVTKNTMSYQRLKSLKEMAFGAFEGESEALNPPREMFENFFVVYGGESRQQVRERMVSTLKGIMELADHQSVLAVSHAGASYTFLEQVLSSEDLERVGMFGNCTIVKLGYQQGSFYFLDVTRFDHIK